MGKRGIKRAPRRVGEGRVKLFSGFYLRELHDDPAACICMQPMENIISPALWDMARTITRTKAGVKVPRNQPSTDGAH
jgi:hypothetical protein